MLSNAYLFFFTRVLVQRIVFPISQFEQGPEPLTLISEYRLAHEQKLCTIRQYLEESNPIHTGAKRPEHNIKNS